MPHGESWLTLLFERFLHFGAILGRPVNDEGVTWLGHSTIRYGHVLSLLLAFVILVGLGLSARARVSDVKKAIVPGIDFDGATFVELFAGYVYDTMSTMMGRKAAKFFLPLIGACAFVIFVSNAIGLVPGFTPATDNLNTTLAMGLVIFFVTHAYGVKENGLAYFKHFLGPVIWLAPLMLPIELISHLSRPLTLGIRLMANMVADHAVLSIFLALAFGVFALPFYLLGCLVVVVQTLVFCLLSTVYISMAIEHHEEGHH